MAAVVTSLGMNRATPSSGESEAFFFTNPIANFTVRLASTVNLTLSGLAAIDGVTPVAGDRILVKNQTVASANGIYVAASGAWTRASDFASISQMLQARVLVTFGVQALTKWATGVASTDVLGTSSILWTKSAPNPPLIFCHGHGVSTLDVLSSTVNDQLFYSLAQDYTVAVADVGFPAPAGGTSDRWGNSVSRSRIDDLRAYMTITYGTTGPVALFGQSQGGGLALNYAYNKGSAEVTFLALACPMISLASLKSNNATYGTEIDAAYSNPYSDATDGPLNSPYIYRASYGTALAAKTAFWTSSADTVVLPQFSDAFVAANPKIPNVIVGSGVHTATIDAAVPAMLAHCQRKRYEAY